MSDDHPPVTITNSEVRTLRSQHVDQQFQLNVTLPPGYHGGDARYPAVYLLDGNWTTGLVTETARTLQLGGEFPPAIIVGVGYVLGEKGPAEVMSLRTRDYTPTPDSGATGENAERMRQMLGDVRPGGAAAFLRFLVDELKPFIASEYRVDDSAGTLAGDSLGGLFGLYTMFHAPEAFDRCLVGSPSIWWDSRISFQYEEAYAAPIPASPPGSSCPSAHWKSPSPEPPVTS